MGLATWCRRMAVLLLVAVAPALSASFSFVKIVNFNTLRPDGQGNFTAQGQPVLENGRVVWDELTSSVWSTTVGGQSYVKVADLNTLAPGGTGNFTQLTDGTSTGGSLVINNGTLFFVTRDSTTNTSSNWGLYTVPAGGGALTLVANYKTPDPSGGTFTSFEGFGVTVGYSISNGNVVFDAVNGTNLPGIYTAGANGSQVARLVDATTPCHPEFSSPVTVFSHPWINANNILFYGQVNGDTFAGYNALYLNNCQGEVVTSNSLLPGNPNSNSHVRFYPATIRMDGSTIVFTADDANSTLTGKTYYKGIFTLSNGVLQKVVATTDTLPGLGPLNGTGTFDGISFNQGNILFRATDGTNTALYVWSNGVISRVVGTGDSLSGDTIVRLQYDPTPNALNGGTVLFTADMLTAYRAIWAAVAPCGSASFTPSSGTLGSSAGSGSVGVTVSGTCGWSASSNASWLTITSGGSGYFNGTVGYGFTANNSVNSRTGSITVADQAFTLTQSGATPSYSLGSTSASAAASGGTGTVSVIASPADAPWTASSNASWITVTSGASGAGNGTVGYSVASNPNTTQRIGTLTIAGQTFTVTQAALGTTSGLAFFPLTPCRVADTRGNGKTGAFGPPAMPAGSTRSFPITTSSCAVPASAQAYSLNVTVVPPAPLTYLSIWPTGQAQPVVSTLNSFDGTVVANAAIVPAGASGAISVFVSDSTDVIIDINGYFAPPDRRPGLLSGDSVPHRRHARQRLHGRLRAARHGPRFDPHFPDPQSSCVIPAPGTGLLAEHDRRPAGTADLSDTWPAGQPSRWFRP